MQNINNNDIAIIGYAFELPNGIDSKDKLWNLLENGQDVIKEIPRDRWDWQKIYNSNPNAKGKSYSYHGAFLDNITKFDSNTFRIMPLECKSIDPQQRIVLKTSWKALENSFLDIEKLKHSNTGVFLGATMDDYMQLQTRLDNGKDINRYTHFGTALNNIAGRVSFFYGFHGPTITIDTACSSSLVAVDSAIKAINEGDCDIALAGGVNIILTEEMYIKFSRTQMLSKTGKCKTFDNSADGYVRGEGCGILVLQKFSEAKQSGKKILAVIRGCSINHNGNSSALTVPNGKAQESLINSCIRKSGLSIEEIDYIEAHGTGTQLGDKIEVNSLQKVFKERKKSLLIGSVKTNLGHLESAAGIAGVIKVLLCMEKNKIAKTANIVEKNHNIAWDKSIIKVVDENYDWNSKNKIAGISSFGASGTNAHVILQKYESNEENRNILTNEGFALAVSANNKKSLYKLLISLNDFIENKSDDMIREICKTYNSTRSHYSNRIAIYGENKEEFTKKLKEKIDFFPYEKKSMSLEELYFNGDVIDDAEKYKVLFNENESYREIVESYTCNICWDTINLHDDIKEMVNEIIMAASFYRYISSIGYQKYKIIGSYKVKFEMLIAENKIGENVLDSIINFVENKLEKVPQLQNDNPKNYEKVENLWENECGELIDLLIEKAVEQYEFGVNIKWNLLYNLNSVNIDLLPGYVFDEQDYWVDYQMHITDNLINKDMLNDYIEVVNDLSCDSEYIWEISLKEDSYLINEHRLNSKKVVVGTFQVQLINELIKSKSNKNYCISEGIFMQKIEMPYDKKMKVCINPSENCNYEGKISCLDEESGIWITKTSFCLLEVEKSDKRDFFTDFIDDDKFIQADEFYDILDNAGLYLGSNFRVIDSVIPGINTAFANITNSVFESGVLDAASQLLYLFKNQDDKGLFVPSYFKEFIQFDSLYKVNRVKAILIEKTKTDVVADLLYFKDNEIIARYSGYHLKRVTQSANYSIKNIIGNSIKLPNGIDLYNYEIKTNNTSLSDHAVYHRLTIPGAYFISQVMELAEKEYESKQYSINDINFYNAIIFEKNTKIKELIQVEKDNAGYNVTIYSSINNKKNYMQNVKLNIDNKFREYSEESVLECDSINIHYSKNEILDVQRKIGLHLGKTFNWIQDAWITDDVVHAKIFNEEFTSLASNYGTPPGLIDTSVQILGLTKNINQKEEGAYIPLNISKIIKYEEFKENMWCIAEIIRESGQVIVGNIKFYDSDRKYRILEISEMSLIKVNAKKLAQIDVHEEIFFREKWSQYRQSNILDKQSIKQIIEFRLGTNTNNLIVNIYKLLSNTCVIEDKLVTDYRDEDLITKILESHLLNQKQTLIVLSDSAINNNIDDVDVNGLSEKSYVLTEFYFSILKIIQNVGIHAAKICVVTDKACNIENNNVSNNFGGCITWGLFRSIQREFKDGDIILLDHDKKWQNDIDTIVQCLSEDNKQICIRNEKTYIPTIIKESKYNSLNKKYMFDVEKSYVCIGGFGALGYETCNMLIDKGINNLIVIGQSSIEEKYEEYYSLLSKRKEVNLKYYQIDVTLEKSYYQIKNILESEKLIGGIFYAVGNVIDKYHTNYTTEDINKVYASKIIGTYILSKVLETINFDFCVCYSSIVSVLGAASQSVYGAANSFQDYICSYMRGRGKNMFTIQWGPWGQVGMFSKINEISKERYEKRNISTLTVEQALAGLQSIICIPQNAIVSNMSTESHKKVPNLDHNIQDIKYDKKIEKNISVIDRVKQIVALAIGFTEYSSIDEDKAFLDMGIDSLLMVEIRMKINKEFNVNLPLEIFFNNINVQSIVSNISYENNCNKGIVFGEI